MKNVTAILSMLHEPADLNSATRRFRQDPVLTWTLDRLTRSERIGTLAILCWDDQTEAVATACEHTDRVAVISKGARQVLPGMNAITTARRC